MVRAAILIVAAFFAGGSVGFFFGARDRRDAVDPVPEEMSPSETTTRDPSGVSRPPPAVERARRAAEDLSELLAAIPSSPAEVGEGLITGRVVDEARAPVPGVLVRALPLRSRTEVRRSPAGADATLEERVRELVRSERDRDLHRREARSGADGTYRLEGLLDASYRLEVSREGFEIELLNRRGKWEARPGESRDFIARPVFEIEAAVLLPDGSAPARADLRFSPVRSRSRTTSDLEWTPQEPRMRLPAGRYRAQAIVSEDLRSEQQEVVLAPGTAPAQIVLQLRATPGIRGAISLPPGEESTSVQVHALRYSGNPPPPRQLRESDLTQWVHEGMESRYSFTDLPAGTYLVGVFRTGGRPAVMEPVEVVDRMVVLDLAIPPLDPSEYVLLRVLGPDGSLLTDLAISVGWRGRNGNSRGGVSPIRRGDGTFLVPHHDPQDGRGDRRREEGVGTIEVTSELHGKKEIEYDPAENREIEVRFSETCTLEVAVEGYAGSGLEGRLQLALVDPAKPRERSFNPSREKVSPEGTMTLGPVEAGSYELVLSIQDERFSGRPILRTPVHLRGGRSSLAVAIPPLHSLTVLVADPPPRTNLQIRRAGPMRQLEGMSREIQDGRVVFEGLPAGEYRIMMWGPEPSEMRVAIPGPSEIRYEPRPLNAMQVSVEDENGLLANAGLRTGDLVIGVNGKELENIAQFHATVAGLMKEEQITFLVQRGEGKLEVKIDPRKFRGGEDHGGQLEPTSR